MSPKRTTVSHSMAKTVVLVFVVTVATWTLAATTDDLLGNELLTSDDLVEKGWDILDTAQREFKEEGRDPLKKTLLPFLIGVTLKAGSIVPVKLMIMTFVIVLALVFAKMGLAISALVGYLQYQEAHKAKLAEVTKSWIIPSTTHSTPILSSPEALASEPQPAVAAPPAAATASAAASGPNKRFQPFQYDPYRYDPYTNDPFRFNRYDYPH